VKNELDLKDLDAYQSFAVKTAAVKAHTRAGKSWATMEFASEILELVSIAKRIVGHVTKTEFRGKDFNREFIEDELGDVLWTLSVLAYHLELDLSTIALKNLAKVGVKHDALKKVVDGVEPKKALPGTAKDYTECPSCKGDLVRESGCVSCKNPSCGWSACS